MAILLRALMSTPGGSLSCRSGCCPTALGQFEQALVYWAPSMGIWCWGGHKGILQRFHTSGWGSVSVCVKQWFILVLAQVQVQFKLSGFELCFSDIIHCHRVTVSNYCRWILVEYANALKHRWSSGSGSSSDLCTKWAGIWFGLFCFLPESTLSPMSLF